MPTAPTGSLGLAMSKLELALADSAAFKTWTGAADQAAALLKIHLHTLPLPGAGGEHTKTELEGFRNFAHIYASPGEDGGGITWQRVASDASFRFSGRGQLACVLEEDVDPADETDTYEAWVKFTNSVEAIIKDVLGVAGVAGYLAFDRLTYPVVGPTLFDKDDKEQEGLYQRAGFRVEFDTV